MHNGNSQLWRPGLRCIGRFLTGGNKWWRLLKIFLNRVASTFLCNYSKVRRQLKAPYFSIGLMLDILMSQKSKSWLCNPDRTPFVGYFIIRRLKLAMVSLCTKCDVPYFTPSKVKERPKIEKKDYYHYPIKSNSKVIDYSSSDSRLL